MRNEKKEEIPNINIERSPLFILNTLVISGLLVYVDYRLLKDINPWGFLMMVPAFIFSFQTLLWILSPFAMVFENRFEIKQSLLHEKIRYFVDIQQIKLTKNKLVITYNDDEQEVLNLFGIKSSQLKTIHMAIAESVRKSIQTRS